MNSGGPDDDDVVDVNNNNEDKNGDVENVNITDAEVNINIANDLGAQNKNIDIVYVHDISDLYDDTNIINRPTDLYVNKSRSDVNSDFEAES